MKIIILMLLACPALGSDGQSRGRAHTSMGNAASPGYKTQDGRRKAHIDDPYGVLREKKKKEHVAEIGVLYLKNNKSGTTIQAQFY